MNPSDRRPVPQSSPDRHGETTAAHDQSHRPDAEPTAPGGASRAVAEPQLPHEIDESSHSQASASPTHGPVGAQAHADAVGPACDTDRGPLLDEVYNRTLAPGRGATPPRR